MSVREHFQNVKTFGDYLKTLNINILNELFTHPSACLAIFRELPSLAQNYVMRLLYTTSPVSQYIVSQWILKAYQAKHLEAVKALSSLHIWIEMPVSGGMPGWNLNPTFRQNFKLGFLGGGGEPWTKSTSMEADPKPKTVSDLDSYALSRWEAILHYLVNTERAQQSDSVSRDTILTFTHSGLMDQEDQKLPQITNEGFQFLLLDTASQVWYFIIKYLEHGVKFKPGLNISQCLAFICSLSFCTMGRDYSTDGFGEPMQQFIQNLREFGLVYQRSRKAGRFYPTKLAINFTSRDRKICLNTDKHKTGFIVVETNYRLYAYSESELQLALVGMFTEFSYRLPNVVVGLITRDSVRQALRSGITAEQIITFIKIHAHEEMIKKSPDPINPLPRTVCDQIILWGDEMKRLTFTESVLYNQFNSQNDYEVVKNFAEKLDGLAHFNDQKRTLVVLSNYHEDVKKFWKKFSKKGSEK